MAMVLQSSRLRLTQAIYFGEPPSGGGSGLISINGDNTPAQTLISGAGIIIVDGGGGAHTITNTGGGGGGVTGSGTATDIAFWDAPTDLSSDNNLYWDNVNKRVGIGTNAPIAPLHVGAQVNPPLLAGPVQIIMDVAGQSFLVAKDTVDGHEFVAGCAATAGLLGMRTNSSMFVQTNALNRMTILGNGLVGFGTVTPNVLGDFNGAIATRKGTVALFNGLNSDIATPDFSYVRLTGPVAPFSLGGFTNGFDGRRLTVYNTTAQTMTIVNDDGSSVAGNRIKTLTGADITLASPGNSIAEFVWDVAEGRWIYDAPPPQIGGTMAIVTVAINTALSSEVFVRVDASGAARTMTLPLIATIGPGKIYYIKKIDSSVHAVSIVCSGADSIDGSSSIPALSLYNQYQTIGIVSPDVGSDWSIF